MKEEKIYSDDNLLRRVQFTHPNFIKPDGTPSSASFSLKKGEDGLSVDIERLTSYQKSIEDPKRFRLFSLSVEFILENKLKAVHDPIPNNSSHALIKGEITRGTARKLARKAKRIPYPD